ncbi:MAG: hypothetical protein ACLP0J_26985 [Solirubrobacteraceae bacterium]|jgi:hypothetical protein
MSTPKSSSANGNGPRNLFVEADPDHDPPTSPRASRATSTRNAHCRARGRGLVVAVDPASSITAPAGGFDATSFTRPNAGLGALGARSRERFGRAEVDAGRLLVRVAARRYPGLSAIVVLGAALIALGWLGFRDRRRARRAPHRRSAPRCRAARSEHRFLARSRGPRAVACAGRGAAGSG